MATARYRIRFAVQYKESRDGSRWQQWSIEDTRAEADRIAGIYAANNRSAWRVVEKRTAEFWATTDTGRIAGGMTRAGTGTGKGFSTFDAAKRRADKLTRREHCEWYVAQWQEGKLERIENNS